MGPSIALRDVSLTLGGNPILAPLSTTLESGRMHVLVGANGAGKTSLLKSMLGLCPHQGEIIRHWVGQPQRPAYIPQQPQFDAVLPVTIHDYLQAMMSKRPVFLGGRDDLLARQQLLLERVGLDGKEDLQLGQLSGGERQRLMFAQALIKSPKLWFLDEPMTGLDRNGQTLLTKLILDLRDQDCTLVMIHHDLEFVREHADNVLLINGGLQLAGAPEDVLPEMNSPLAWHKEAV